MRFGKQEVNLKLKLGEKVIRVAFVLSVEHGKVNLAWNLNLIVEDLMGSYVILVMFAIH